MKLRSLFFGTLCMLMLGVSFTSCSDDDDDSKKNDEGSKVELPEKSCLHFEMKVLIKRTMPASHTMIPIKETM